MKASNRREFLKSAGVVAATFAVPASLWSCSEAKQGGTAGGGGTATGKKPAGQSKEWAGMVAKFEADGILTQDKPGKWAGKQGSHIPRVTFHEGEGAVTLWTKHGMSPTHWITAHYLRDQDGKLLGFQAYAGTDKEAKHRFVLPKGTTKITAYSHCNKHGDWRAADSKVG